MLAICPNLEFKRTIYCPFFVYIKFQVNVAEPDGCHDFASIFIVYCIIYCIVDIGERDTPNLAIFQAGNVAL